MFFKFVFVLSQTYLLFCLNICMFCICVVTKLSCVLFKSLYVVHLCCLKLSVGSVYMFACFAFVLSQTYNVFCSIVCIVAFVLSQTCFVCYWNICSFCNCVVTIVLWARFSLNVCMFCVCVVPNVWCVLSKCLPVLHLCCHKRMMGSVEMFACFTCICVVTNCSVFCLNVRMFCICVIANVTCVLLKCLLILQLCRHNRYALCGLCLNFSMFSICVVSNVYWVLSKCLRVLHLCRHKLTLCSV